MTGNDSDISDTIPRISLLKIGKLIVKPVFAGEIERYKREAVLNGVGLFSSEKKRER